jgi:hypothetical protein
VGEVAELEPGAQAIQVFGGQRNAMAARELEQRHRADGALEVQMQLRLRRCRDVLLEAQGLTISACTC